MTCEGIYRSAMLMIGEAPDNLCYTAQVTDALSLICLRLEPLAAAYDAAWKYAHSAPIPLGALCEPFPLPTLFLPIATYMVAAELGRARMPQAACEWEVAAAQMCQQIRADLPATLHAIRDHYA